MRGAAQIISYEIVILSLIFFPLLVSKSFSLYEKRKSYGLNFLLLFPIFFFWLISVVAETNRSPFDFAEGERELVSGFKTEYSGLAFALLFLGEYGKIIFVRFFTTFLFFPNLFVFLFFIPFFVIGVFLIFRGTFPRFRYDLLMGLA